MSTTPCRVYRCHKQPEMYLYLRADLDPEDADVIPAALRERTGALSLALELDLHPQRTLARVDVNKVLAGLQDPGWFLQMPPPEIVNAPLYWGD